ncbi:hypothetical protein EUGRSUZ_C01481 [Eucalyptus grandis]|uniref:Uncharacterized protein n=2 Tax=Eucalyptus grandis TaxID=71139 RepID=A0ACC3LD73_EUCGR|nr:hypothetical protein EUGRSUZ_C01481 [Eucalyptus grandis]
MQSTISISIISENYVSSKWCLRELVQMLKCKRSKGQKVLPIFYKVEPHQVRHLTGRLRKAIDAHKKNTEEMVVKEWEEALKEVSSLKGWESEKIDNGHEGTLVKIVVTKVLSELKGTFQLIVPQQLVGIDDHIEHIMSLIDAKFNGTWIIGIYGMGGIGKTTLAKVLYNKFFGQFEIHSFVADCQEAYQRKGIKCLQRQLISSVGSPCDVSNVDKGIHLIKSRFAHKKALIFLDDIGDSAHLKYLVDRNWSKVGSIIIITTRNKDVLDQASANHTYQLNELSFDQSLILFSRHAFQKDYPPSDYEDISRDVVSITGGLPLAIEVIGSFLCRKRENVWKDTLKKLKKIATELKVLTLSKCQFLKRTPDLSTFKRLEILKLENCENLEELHPSIGNLASLIKLNLRRTSIMKLSESIGNLQSLRVLDIGKTGITELPDAIGTMAKLQKLKAECCRKLEQVPSNICKLISLKELHLNLCKKLQELPELPPNLTKLSITCQGQSLPHLSQLTLLEMLTLNGCCQLECVPELPIGLSLLHIWNCGKLKALTNLSDLKHLQNFQIMESPSLEGSPDVSNFRRTQMRELGLKESRGLMRSLIFKRSPRWFPRPED